MRIGLRDAEIIEGRGAVHDSGSALVVKVGVGVVRQDIQLKRGIFTGGPGPTIFHSVLGWFPVDKNVLVTLLPILRDHIGSDRVDGLPGSAAAARGLGAVSSGVLLDDVVGQGL